MKTSFFLAASLAAVASPAVAQNVTSIEIEGGTFAWTYYLNAPQALSAGPGSNASLPRRLPWGSGANPIVYGYLFDLPFLGYVAGSAEGNPITAEIVGNTISIDLSGWVWDWNASVTASGGIAMGTANETGEPGLYSFNVSWSSMDMGGPTQGQTMTWELTGYAQAVPEPASYAMLLSGIALVLGRKYWAKLI